MDRTRGWTKRHFYVPVKWVITAPSWDLWGRVGFSKSTPKTATEAWTNALEPTSSTFRRLAAPRPPQGGEGHEGLGAAGSCEDDSPYRNRRPRGAQRFGDNAFEPEWSTFRRFRAPFGLKRLKMISFSISHQKPPISKIRTQNASRVVLITMRGSKCPLPQFPSQKTSKS